MRAPSREPPTVEQHRVPVSGTRWIDSTDNLHAATLPRHTELASGQRMQTGFFVLHSTSETEQNRNAWTTLRDVRGCSALCIAFALQLRARLSSSGEPKVWYEDRDRLDRVKLDDSRVNSHVPRRPGNRNSDSLPLHVGHALARRTDTSVDRRSSARVGARLHLDASRSAPTGSETPTRNAYQKGRP